MSDLIERVWSSVQACRREYSESGPIAFSAAAPEPTIMSLCLAVLVAELYGQLERTDQSWAATLLHVQEADTGLFGEPLLRAADSLLDARRREYTQLQTSYFVLNALDALQLSPRYPLLFVSPFAVQGYMEQWLGSLNWSQPWRESNMVMFIAAALWYRWVAEGDESAREAVMHALDWLDRQQDPETGLWGTQRGASLLDAMAGAYHFLPFYFVAGQRLLYVERVIDSTLSLQQADGLFHPEGGGDACLDVDAIDILVKLSIVTSHRRSEVEAALERAYHGLLVNQDDDGGFCRARLRPYPPKSRKRRIAEAFGVDRLLGQPYRPPRQVAYYGGWNKMPYDIRRSDLWSTWFRSFGLALISSHLPGTVPPEVRWTFRRLPALGWHDPELIAAIPGAHQFPVPFARRVPVRDRGM